MRLFKKKMNMDILQYFLGWLVEINDKTRGRINIKRILFPEVKFLPYIYFSLSIHPPRPSIYSLLPPSLPPSLALTPSPH